MQKLAFMDASKKRPPFSSLGFAIKKKQWWLAPAAIVVLGFLVALLLYSLAVKPLLPRHTPAGQPSSINGMVTPLLDNKLTISQTFSCEEPLLGFSLAAGTYGKTIFEATVHGKINNATTGELIQSFDILVPVIENNQNFEILFDAPLKTPVSQLSVTFYFSGLEPGLDNLALFLADSTEPCLVDGEEQPGSLYFSPLISSGFLFGYYWAIAGALVLFLAILWVLVFTLRAKPQTIFLLAGAVMGLLFTFVYPPYTHADDKTHMAETIFFANQVQGEKEYYREDGLWHYETRAADEVIYQEYVHPQRQYYHWVQTQLFQADPAPGESIENKFERVGVFYQYIPQTLGVLAARVLNFGQVPTLYMGRLFSLAAYLAICFFAIKITPFKTLFTLICLTPYALRTAGSFSYDTSILALVFLFCAIALHLAYEKSQVSFWDLLLLAGLFLLIAPLKYVYTPCFLLVFLIPSSKWPFRKKSANSQPNKRAHLFRLGATALVIGAIALAAWLIVNKALEFRYSFSDEGTETTAWWLSQSYTFRLLLVNPREFFRLIAVTAVDTASTIFSGMIDIFPTEHAFTASLAGSVILLLAVSPVAGEESPLVPRRQKMLLALVFLVCYGAVLTVSILWTGVGSYYIDANGPTGRYYLPLYPILWLLAQGLFTRKKNNDAALLYSFCILNAYCLISPLLQGFAR